MQIYDAPLQDMRFNLEAFGYDQLAAIPEYEDYDLESVSAILGEAARLLTEQALPLNRKGDHDGLGFDPKTGDVTTPEGFKALYDSYMEMGLMGISADPEWGGSGAPDIVRVFIAEMATATNKSFSMCPGLTHGLMEALEHFGTREQKAEYLPKLISGEWAGTMCLTEPQAGTDLGILTTKAVPDGDSYLLTGTKIWITFGEHDLSDNIVHLVLARLPDAPRGTKGISTFMVPKFNADGTRNGITCGGLEHKMGIKASPTCVMNMEDARGYLIGEPHKGMRTMFVMMNAERLGVGLEGVALGEIAYQTALAFAKDRRQSRALDPARREQGVSADNILVHPDVRRMLANIKATNEPMRGLITWGGILVGLAKSHPDAQVREDSGDLLALLTPIVKSYCTERGFWNTSEAMQICGGSGYTTDWSIEQYMRDCRIAMIYEGTNHIQALDLVGRKLPAKGGRAVRLFAGLVTDVIREHGSDPEMAEHIEALKDSSKQLNEVTMALATKGPGDPEVIGASASNYLNLFALTALGYVWIKQLAAAKGRTGAFYESKRKTANYFFKMILPERHTLGALIGEGKDAIMALEADDF